MIELHGEQWATTAEAAAALHEAGQLVTQQRIRDWARGGHLEPIRVDGRNLWRMRDVWEAEARTRRHVSARGGRPRGTSTGRDAAA